LPYGGLGAIVLLVRQLGLAQAIDRRLNLLKIHLPYHESDHVLNLAYNALCDGTCVDDIELRRNDEVLLDAMGARRISDPTTARDFCRRFQGGHIQLLQDIFDEARRNVWAQQPPFARAGRQPNQQLGLTPGLLHLAADQKMDAAGKLPWCFWTKSASSCSR
jgi:hypothetical protein